MEFRQFNNDGGITMGGHHDGGGGHYSPDGRQPVH